MRQSVDIAFIQETHLSDTEHLKLRTGWVGNVFCSSFTSKARGVALLINKKLNFQLNSVEKDRSGRFLLVNGTVNNNKITLINVYGPNYDDPTFFNNLVMRLGVVEGLCITGGDFNLVLDPSMDRTATKSLSLTKSATIVTQGLKDLGFCDIWRKLHPNDRDYSFYSSVHNSYSRIDMFLVSENMLTMVKNCSYLAATLSDHNPIVLSLETNIIHSSQRTWRFQPYLLKDPEFVKFMNNQIDIFLETNLNSAPHSIVWDSLKAYMRGHILSYCSHKVKEKKKMLIKLEKEIRECEQLHCNIKNQETLNTLSQKRLIYNNLCTNKAEAAMARTRYHYYEFGEKTSKLLAWQIKKQESDKYIQEIQTEEEELTNNPTDINSRFKKFYETLYQSDLNLNNTEAKNFLQKLNMPKLNAEKKKLLDTDIAVAEVCEAVNSLQNNKSPGPDGFPVEYYKVFLNKLAHPLTNMIIESLANEQLPSSLEMATIILLPKPGKNKQKCDSYRPLSLLNADYKILAKLIANRLEKVIPKLIHADQTGFVKGRQGSDNVRRLFHIIDAAQKQEDPMLILSMDAFKAFDRIEPIFLFETLEAMNFGNTFIKCIKTIFNAPKARILTNGVLSDPISLSRGCRQGCPASPLLFNLAIEPLACAIRSNSKIAGIKFGGAEHKISLYADDLLMYIMDPLTSFPLILECLEEYSAASGYKLNLTKSEILPFNVHDTRIRQITSPLKWSPKGIKYLGIWIGKSFDKTYSENYIKLMEQTKLDIKRWMDLPLSLIGRINTIKMNIVPKYIYFFHCIPFKVPVQFFKDLNKTLSSFVWHKKPPRVKITTLQRPFSKGGLNFPNFRKYYLAAQFRSIWTWIHSEDHENRWISIEKKELQTTPLKVAPFLGNKSNLSAITKNKIIQNTFVAWQESHLILGLNTSLLRNTPLWKNPYIPKPIADSILKGWVDKGIKTVGDLYTEGVFSSFQQLSQKYNLPQHNLFKYLQIRHWVKTNSSDRFPDILEETPLEEQLFNTLRTSTRGLTSAIYNILNNECPENRKSPIKHKWEGDLNCSYDDADWNKLLEQAQTLLTSTKHRLIQFNILHRTYYTPVKLHTFNNSTSPVCQKCKFTNADLLHMFWHCPLIAVFWNYIIKTTSDITQCTIPIDPKVWILGDVNALKINNHIRHFILLASTAGKKCILVNWKSDAPPSQRHWINELTSYCTPEKILYNVRKRPTTFRKIWGAFIDALPHLKCNG